MKTLSQDYLNKALLLLLVALCLPTWGEINRDSNEDEQRVEVLNFVLKDFQSHPKQGISGQVVQALITDKRAEYGRSMSLTELNHIADRITQLYREQGFQFSYAYIPQQRFISKTITIAIMEGTLGDVKIYNNSLYDDAAIRKPFAALLGQLIYQPEIEAAVAELKTYPGLAVFSYYSRGSNSGQTRLNIKVTAEQRGYGNLRIDNYGSESTGETRLVGQFNLNNPLGMRGSAAIGVQQSLDNSDGENNSYGLLRYALPLFNMNHYLSLSLSNNQFEIGDSFSSLELQGDAKIINLGYRTILQRGKALNQSLALYYDNKQTDFDDSPLGNLLDQDEEVSSLSLNWQLSHSSFQYRWNNQFTLSYTQGDFDSNALGIEGEDFEKAQLSVYSALSLGGLDKVYHSVISLRLRGQYSNAFLPNIEKMILGGPYSVRAIKSGFFSADRGAIATIEWQLPRLIHFDSDRFRLSPFLFADFGYGEKLNLEDKPFDRSKVSGYGLGVDASFGESISARLTVSEIEQEEIDSGLLIEASDVLLEASYYFK